MTDPPRSPAFDRLGALLGLAATLFVPALFVPAPSAAEIVVMTDGSWLRVAGYELVAEGERIRLDLEGGGALVMSLLRVQRILDDEIDRSARNLPETRDTAFLLRFADHQTVPEVPYGELIFETARRHRLNPALVAAVASAESAFDDTAVSHKGAQGLMQLMPATAERFGVRGRDVFDPVLNLDAGSRYLSWLIDRFHGDLALVLAGYNAGEGTVDRYGGVPPYRETRSFVARIFDRLGIVPSATGEAG